MGRLVDSSVLIAAERGTLDRTALAAIDDGSGLFLSVVTASELLHGVHRLRSGAHKVRAEAWVESLLARVPLLDFDVVCARTHARIGAGLAERGVTLGAHDLQIAATAIVHGLAVLTRDRRGFSSVPDLTIEIC